MNIQQTLNQLSLNTQTTIEQVENAFNQYAKRVMELDSQSKSLVDEVANLKGIIAQKDKVIERIDSLEVECETLRQVNKDIDAHFKQNSVMAVHEFQAIINYVTGV